jgi:hypothetical protein
MQLPSEKYLPGITIEHAPILDEAKRWHGLKVAVQAVINAAKRRNLQTHLDSRGPIQYSQDDAHACALRTAGRPGIRHSR